jgi:hypothetical protein
MEERMRRLTFTVLGATLGSFLVATLVTREASADEASVTVGPIEDHRYADPPPRPPPLAEGPASDDPEAYRSPVRFTVGPAGFVSESAHGFGLGIATDLGTGVIGVRLAASWLGPGARVSLDQYTGEIVLDALPHGPLHPVLGVGFGLAHMDFQGVGGDLGIGVARLGLEYSLALRDADLRVGANVTGALPGPRDATVPSDLGAYAVFGGAITLGF